MGQTRYILIIDDDENQLRLLRGVLSGEGYDVAATADGPQGLLIFKQRRPDLVLLDIGLPSMDGLEVLSTMRREDPTLNVIVITGYHSAEMTVQAIRSGARDLIRKPFDVNDLLTKVRNAFTFDEKSNE